MSQAAHAFLLLLLSSSISVSVTENYTVTNATAFLERFGYVDKNAITDLTEALIQFQERYNLPVSGELDEPTIALMKRPRCSESDIDFTIHSKWNKTNLSWYFPQASPDRLNTAKRAFDMWEGISVLKFEQVKIPAREKPDITITFGGKRHKTRADCQGNGTCSRKFDGVGVQLAHAFFPERNRCREIHFDSSENWYYGLDAPPNDDQTSFLMVLVHELGHSLGLAHSGVETAIMFPWYQGYGRGFDEDDKAAIEYLYGMRPERKFASFPKSPPPPAPPQATVSPTRVVPPSTTPLITTTPTISQKPVTPRLDTPIKPRRIPKLCEIQAPDFMFLAAAPQFPNYRMYVVSEGFLWKLDLNDSRSIPEHPELLDDYLPTELKGSRVSHVFQNSVGDLVTLMADNICYAATFPTLQIRHRFQFTLPTNARINAVFQTNSGQSYLLYNNDSYIEFGEVGYILNRGPLNYLFPGIPSGILSAFRYTDGYMYFFTKNTYYKYSEYTRRVVDAGAFNWGLFEIPCPNTELLYQLKTLVSKLVSIYE